MIKAARIAAFIGCLVAGASTGDPLHPGPDFGADPPASSTDDLRLLWRLLTTDARK